jgi:cbb3-type cytochrome oxidase cytochrome c subunit
METMDISDIEAEMGIDAEIGVPYADAEVMTNARASHRKKQAQKN